MGFPVAGLPHLPEHPQGEGRPVPQGAQAVRGVAEAAAEACPFIHLLVGIAAAALGPETHQAVAAAGPQGPGHQPGVEPVCHGSVPGSAAEPLLQEDGHRVAGLLADRPLDVGLHRELVGAVTHGHE